MAAASPYKLCSSCKKRKPYRAFRKRNKKPVSMCKDCEALGRIEKRHEIKARAVKMLGGKCAHCGLVTDVLAVYDFHHTDPKKKKANIGTLIKEGATDRVLQRELKKCILLCKNCHAMLHYSYCYPPPIEED